MDPEQTFAAASAVVLPGWAILILAPRGRWGWLDALPRIAIPLALSALYAVLILARLAGAEGGFGSLAEVKALFADDWILLAGWVHYLAFDLFVGAVLAGWMDRDGVHRVVQAPILALTFLLGPLGAVVALLTLGALRLRGRRAPVPMEPAR